MYQAELNNKLPDIKTKEDILTSNVFSFFKYARRDLFLQRYLESRLGIQVTEQDAIEAEFRFWPRYADNTEPDVVIIIGNYYLLVEAKYLGDFSMETSMSKSQLVREIENGELEAKSYGKEFCLIAITADPCFRSEKFSDVPPKFMGRLVWTNWQSVATFLEEAISLNTNLSSWEREFALDLQLLLDRKKLRGYRGIDVLQVVTPLLPRSTGQIFFEAAKAEFRGEYVGFIESLQTAQEVGPTPRNIFFSRQGKPFASLHGINNLSPPPNIVFFDERSRR